MTKTLLFAIIFLFHATVARKGFGPGEQEWKYTDVREGAHMFWWLYYTTAPVLHPEDRPLIIWLQGGPGASSTGFGNFEEIGPLDEHLNPRNFTWVKDYNVVFVDNPVGAGFSYVDDDSLLTESNAQIAQDLMVFMHDFYDELPQFEKTPMYIVAESYGGKMAVDFALLLDEEIKLGMIKSNFKGIALGDSWISPIDSTMTWASYLFEIGIVDDAGYDAIDEIAEETKRLVEEEKWEEATAMWTYLKEVLENVTYDVDWYNVLKKISVPDPKNTENIMNELVKPTLGLPPFLHWVEENSKVRSALAEDFMKPAIKSVERILNETDLIVVVYTGQTDLIVDTPGTMLWVKALKWYGMENWMKATRRPLAVDGFLEGYEKIWGNFYVYWVLRAGHMVPADNPYAMNAILEKFTNTDT